MISRLFHVSPLSHRYGVGVACAILCHTLRCATTWPSPSIEQILVCGGISLLFGKSFYTATWEALIWVVQCPEGDYYDRHPCATRGIIMTLPFYRLVWL